MSETDPFAENEAARDGTGAPASLAATYERQSGEMMVYGGTFFGLFFLLGGIMSGTIAFLLLACAMLGSAFYFFPMIRTERAQLRVEPRGFYLDGMGWLPWSAISSVRMYDRAVRTIRNAHLELTLAAPADDVVLKDDGKPDAIRSMMTTVWSLKRTGDGDKNRLVVIRLEPLSATPEAIIGAMRRYMRTT
ncbi:hypothetical protein [Pyruvatibacter sp.]|uniref:hypothetical protein n=1 Tax=Pyruvatibacter sp. TaxID=1981328 RepID=UPI0032F07430